MTKENEFSAQATRISEKAKSLSMKHPGLIARAYRRADDYFLARFDESPISSFGGRPVFNICSFKNGNEHSDAATAEIEEPK